MDPRQELIELIKQSREHLRYFRELGLTNVGEDLAPSAGNQYSVKVEDSSAEPATVHTAPPALHFEAPLNALPPPSSAISEAKSGAQPGRTVEATMTTKKDQPATSAPSLFGELSASSPEEQHPDETLEDIRLEMGDCKRCKLWTTRTNLVFGEGNPMAALMFIGEAPGADEDASGRPFVGRAGQLLTKMIEAIGLKREDVYIANVLKSRPPGNRAPEKDEVAACIPFLFRQIASIRPRLIVALGNPAMQALLNTKTGITQMRGQFQDYPRIPEIKVLPTFHPAYLLRSPDKKREAWEDLKKVREFLKDEG
jgi:DNA polymerase